MASKICPGKRTDRGKDRQDGPSRAGAPGSVKRTQQLRPERQQAGDATGVEDLVVVEGIRQDIRLTADIPQERNLKEYL